MIKFKIDCGETIGANTGFWKAAGHDDLFWLTLDPAGQALLDRMQQKQSCRYVRNHYTLNEQILYGRQLGGEVYSENADGQAVYDFSKINRIFAEYVRRGIKPIVECDYLPELLTVQDSSQSPARDEGLPAGDRGPSDWGKWSELLRAFVRNLVDTFGQTEVRTWYFEVWNEPDHWPIEDMPTFFRMYDVFVDAVTSVDNQLRVGGPACYTQFFLRDFLQHVTKGRNYVTGEVGTRIDFLSYHIYGLSGGWLNEHPLVLPTVQRFVQELLWIQRLMKRFPGLEHVEFHLNEWGVCSNYMRTVAEHPALEYRNSEFSGLFLVKLVHHLWAVEDAYQFPTAMLLYWGFSMETAYGELFRGNRDLLTAGNVPKPVQTAHEMLALLGNERLAVSGFKAGGVGTVGVMATRTGDSQLELLAYHFNELAEEDEAADSEAAVSVQLVNLPLGKLWLEVDVYVLDREHHNTYRQWQQQGSPRTPEEADVGELIKAGELSPDSRFTAFAENGVTLLEWIMPKQSLQLCIVRVV